MRNFFIAITLLCTGILNFGHATDIYSDPEHFYEAVQNSGPRELALVGNQCGNRIFFSEVKVHFENFNYLKAAQDKLRRLELEDRGITAAQEKLRESDPNDGYMFVTARIEDLLESAIGRFTLDAYRSGPNGGTSHIDNSSCIANAFASNLANNELPVSPLALAYSNDNELFIAVVPSIGVFNQTLTPEQAAKNSYFSASPLFTDLTNKAVFKEASSFFAKADGLRLQLKNTFVDADDTAAAFILRFNTHQLKARRAELAPILKETRDEIARLKPLAAIPSDVLENRDVGDFIARKVLAKWK